MHTLMSDYCDLREDCWLFHVINMNIDGSSVYIDFHVLWTAVDHEVSHEMINIIVLMTSAGAWNALW